MPIRPDPDGDAPLFHGALCVSATAFDIKLGVSRGAATSTSPEDLAVERIDRARRGTGTAVGRGQR